MAAHDAGLDSVHPHCCPCLRRADCAALSRRDLLKTGGLAGFGGVALAGLEWPVLAAAAAAEATAAPPRAPLAVKPVLMYEIPKRRPKTSWRSWGGIQTQADADAEVARLCRELDKLRAGADFPLQILPVSAVRNGGDFSRLPDMPNADVILLYAAGGPSNIIDAAAKTGKPVVIFLRHTSGPVSLWYEIISPRYLHQHTDKLSTREIDNSDIVVDALGELVWRLRALCGLRNTVGSRIVAVGGPGGWATPKAPDLARQKFKLDIQTVDYKELGELIKAARADGAAVESARARAAAYLKHGRVKLETERVFVENAFLLERIFRALMKQANCRAITINNCMSTIMPMSETTACLTLSLLNDDGYLAFCESDFVVIPAGILFANISGKPAFLNDPTYPHQGVITVAHCTAPRRMDGKNLEPVRIVTHFESDYGAAPKVEMRKGQKVTNIIPDFKAELFTGFVGEIVGNPFLPICRAQIEVAYAVSDDLIAQNMPGFHWITGYGDYTREIGYALKKIPIEWVRMG